MSEMTFTRPSHIEYVTVVCTGGGGVGSQELGHEGAGPQPTDAKSTSDAMCEALQGWATALCKEAHARTMDDAISALHRQHTPNGRPARYLPEA